MPQFDSILVIGTVWPEPASSAAGSRMMQLLRLLKESGGRIIFASHAAKSPYSADLTQSGIDEQPIRLNHASFDRFVSDLTPDLVLYDRFMTEEQYGWRVADAAPEAIRMLDTEDLHSLRQSRAKAIRENQMWSEQDLLNEDTALREIASIHRCDLSIMISEAEMEILTRVFKVDKEKLLYLPFMLSSSDIPGGESVPALENRSGFSTIGNFRHPPNRDSVLRLKKEIWPELRKMLPNQKLRIWGAYPTQQMQELHSEPDGFLIEGRAESAIEAVSQCRVMLAPLRFGAGLKGKIVDAMISGTSFVTTPVGAEGLFDPQDLPGSVAETTDEFVKKAIQLHEDRSAWTEASERGLELAKSRFHEDIHSERFMSAMSDLSKNLKARRTRHFTGRMLMHHSMAASRYMSKWIEEKEGKG